MNYSASNYEKGLIGCLILDPSIIYEADSVLEDADFKEPKSRTIYQTIKKLLLDDKKFKLDIAIVRSACKNDVQATYFTECMQLAPSVALSKEYISKIKENSTRWSLIGYFSVANKEAQNVNGNFNDWLNKKESEFRQIVDSSRKSEVSKTLSPQSYCDEALRLYEGYKENPGVIRGLRTGFEELDRITKGLKTLNVISATTGAGKTTLAANWATNIALAQGIQILYINFEMHKDDLIRRIVSAVSEVESDKILYGKYGQGEWEKVKDILQLIKAIDTLHITDNEPRNISATCSLIYHFKNLHDIQVVFVDYIGEIEPDKQALKESSEYFTYGRYTQTLKDVCAHLGIKCVLVTQMGRPGEDTPRRRNIQGSWKIVQKADIFIILYFDEKLERYKLRIDKQRHGIYPYEISLKFRKQIHKFSEAGHHG